MRITDIHVILIEEPWASDRFRWQAGQPGRRLGVNRAWLGMTAIAAV